MPRRPCTPHPNPNPNVSTKVNKLIETYRSEGDRSRVKLQNIQRKKQNSDCGTESSMRSSASLSTKSIMTVRTLKESLSEETKITSLKRKRRSARIQINHIKKNGSYSNEFNDLLSVTTSSSVCSVPGNCVEFDRVSVREYEVICGDNPSVVNGPPLGIGWKNDTSFDGTVEAYEKERDGQRGGMKLTAFMRRNILADHGFSDREINACARKAAIARKKRIQTIDSYQLNPNLDEKIERLTRLLTRGCDYGARDMLPVWIG